MKRAPIIAVATAVGLAGVLAFHTKSAPLALGIPSSATTSKGSSLSLGGAGSSSTTTTTPGTTSTTSPATTTTTPGTTSTTSPATTTTTAPSATRVVTGPSVNYNYGVLSVSVTATGKKITNVGIGSLDDGGNFRSQSIDQQSIPILEQEALAAQSANIQAVSGASYTSAGFEQSLQSALNQLGIS